MPHDRPPVTPTGHHGLDDITSPQWATEVDKFIIDPRGNNVTVATVKIGRGSLRRHLALDPLALAVEDTDGHVGHGYLLIDCALNGTVGRDATGPPLLAAYRFRSMKPPTASAKPAQMLFVTGASRTGTTFVSDWITQPKDAYCAHEISREVHGMTDSEILDYLWYCARTGTDRQDKPALHEFVRWPPPQPKTQ